MLRVTPTCDSPTNVELSYSPFGYVPDGSPTDFNQGRGLSTSIATDGFCDGESNVTTAIVVFLSSLMKGTLTRANAILQKGIRHT